MKNKKRNLRQQLIPAFIITACIPIAIFAFISQERLKKSTLDNLNNQAEAELEKTDQSLNMTLDKYETILYDITTDEEFLNLVVNAATETDIMESDAYALRREFSHICNRNSGVEGIQIILPNHQRIFYDRLSSSSVNSKWITDIQIPDKNKLVSFSADKEQKESQENMFHIARKVVDYWDINKELGYVILSVNVDTINTSISTGNESILYLLEDGVIVGAKEQSLLGKQSSELKQNGVKYREKKNERSGWNILLCQSMKPYQTAIEEQIIFWILVGVAVLGIFVYLIYKVTEPVMTSVNDIVEAMDNVETENFQTSLCINKKDSTEIQRISDGFNKMVARIRMLIEQVKKSTLEQKNAEISALEAQIDPHFLYNILDTINWKAIENEQYEISQMIVALADILRYAINDAGEFTTISAEQNWLEKYVLLQQEKLGEKIRLEFEMDEELGKIKIHKMLLQPFVENAVKYGFRGSKEEHELVVKIAKTEECLHIIIRNNGNPMEKQVLQELNNNVEMKNHFGVANVRKRLTLYYGEEARIYFENIAEHGVKVHMFIPLEEGDKNADSSN